MDTLQALRTFHDRIDVAAARVAAVHAERLHCRLGCSACCDDDLTVFEVEAARIRDEFPQLLATGTPGAEGACAFLDDAGACRVYSARPYVCRTQGLPLRYLAEDEEGEIVEVRDICPLNLEGPELELIAEDDCWTLGIVEDELARLQFAATGGYERVALRDLFASKS